MRQHADAAPLGRLQSELRRAVANAPLPRLVRKPKQPGAMARAEIDPLKMLRFHGGMEDLGRFHTTLVRGGVAWA